MTPLNVFYSVLFEAEHRGGENVPFAFIDRSGIFSVSYTLASGPALSEDDEERVRSMIASIEDSKSILEEAKNNS